MCIGFYFGIFDLIMLGYLDIIQCVMVLVDWLVIGVVINWDKGLLFLLDEWVEMVCSECVVIVDCVGGEILVYFFENLLIDCVCDVGVLVIVCGLCVVVDFEYEFQMVGMNCVLDVNIEMVFFMVDVWWQVIVLKFVKEIVWLGGDVSKFVMFVVNDVLIVCYLV